MRIDTLRLQNVRALESFEANFQPGFNLIVGKNATGKTTLLQLLARVLSQWTPAPRALLQRPDPREEIRNGEGAPYKKVHEPCQVEVSGLGADGMPFGGSDTYPRQGDASLSRDIALRRDQWRRQVEAEDMKSMPLLALFSPYRDPPKGRRPRRAMQEPLVRVAGYDDAFDLWADIKTVTTWFRTLDLASIQEGRTFLALESAREAITACLPDCADIRYMPRYDEVMIKWTDGSYEPIWRLSDGYRTMAALVGEMAWRGATLNPLGDAGRPGQIEGVVLIDELDIHLHPEWQREVVGSLRATFPRVQFIATTHSPFIVQSMRAEEVINLDHHDAMEYWREGIEDIAVEVMGVEEGAVPRSEIYRKFEQLSEQYMALVQRLDRSSPEIGQVRAQLDQLQEELNDNPAVAAVLRAQRLAREAGA